MPIGRSLLLAAAQNNTLNHGWIGLGSFDDLGKFRNLQIQGEKK